MRVAIAVYGPYEDKRNSTWYVRIAWYESGQRRTERHSYQTREKAQRRADREREALVRPEETTVEEAVDQWIAEEKRDIKDSRRPKVLLLDLLAPDLEQPVGRLSPDRATALYDRLMNLPVRVGGKPENELRPRSAAHHRYTLGRGKEWGRWLVRKGLAGVNPFAEVVPRGRPKAGAESKVWLDPVQLGKWAKATEKAIRAGELGDGALAAYLIYALALRASEPGSMHALEPSIPGPEGAPGQPARARFRVKGSSRQRIRHLRLPLPDWLAPLFEGRAEAGERLLTAERSTVREAVQKLCLRAGVPVTCPHGLRESVIDYQAAVEAEDGGLDQRLLGRMAALHGHTAKVAERHYMAPGRMAEAAAVQTLRVIQGGKMAQKCSPTVPRDPSASSSPTENPKQCNPS